MFRLCKKMVLCYISDMAGIEASGSNSSLIDPEDMLQAVESDESL